MKYRNNKESKIKFINLIHHKFVIKEGIIKQLNNQKYNLKCIWYGAKKDVPL